MAYGEHDEFRQRSRLHLPLKLEIICNSSALIGEFNRLLNPLLIKHIEGLKSKYHIKADRVGKDGCYNAMNPISYWSINKPTPKKPNRNWFEQFRDFVSDGDYVGEIVTESILQDRLRLRFYILDNYWDDLEAAVNAIHNEMLLGNEGFGVISVDDLEQQLQTIQLESKQMTNQPKTDEQTSESPSENTPLSSITGNNKSAPILIVTVTKVEAQAVHDAFYQKRCEKWVRRMVGGRTYTDLGNHGDAQVLMAQSEMGTATPSGSLITVLRATQDLHPQAIIMCGIAYGLRPTNQKLGEILVSKQLQYYEPQKFDIKKDQLPRGDRVTASEQLLGRFRSGDNDWQGAKTHFGLVLSGEKLVNDPDFRDRLLKYEPEAIGGEMEGAGLYTAARVAKVDWILVKAICDWADGTKNDEIQPEAALNAAEFVLHVVQLGGWEKIQTPDSDSEPSSSDWVRVLLDLAEEIRRQTNLILIENQKILTPFLKDLTKRDIVYENMVELYNVQRSRGNFGEWISYLENTIRKIEDQGLKDLASDLLSDLHELQNVFYTDNLNSVGRDISERFETNKLSVVNALNRAVSQINDNEAITLVQRYLNHLREIVGSIGRVIGILKTVR